MNKEQIEKHLDFVRKDIDHLYFLLDHLMKENNVVPSRVHSMINKCESISNMFEMLLDSDVIESNRTTCGANIEQEIEHKDIDSSSRVSQTIETTPTLEVEVTEHKIVEEVQPQENIPSQEVHQEIAPVTQQQEIVEEPVVSEPVPFPENEITRTFIQDDQVKEVSRVKRIYDNIQLDPAVVAFLDPKENRRIALNLNDRLMYVRDIFQGNMQMLDQTVEQLNSFQSEQEALACLSQVTDWQDDPVHHAFLEQVKRKFI